MNIDKLPDFRSLIILGKIVRDSFEDLKKLKIHKNIEIDFNYISELIQN